MRAITRLELDNLLIEAKKLPRRRTILRLHQHHEPVQRMVNALHPGSYVTPHKHENPDKVELFALLLGQVSIVQFNDLGEIVEVQRLSENSPTRLVEITPRTYHTVIAHEPSALLEIIEGPYDAATHKVFASWAPREEHPRARDYLLYLASIVDNWKPRQNDTRS
jgi:cupin fold WbuC family metalloprotein